VQAAQRTIPEVVEIQLVDDGLHRDDQLRELMPGFDAVGDGDQLDAEALEQAHQPKDFRRIAGQAREIVDQQHLEGGGLVSAASRRR